jgi:hypothetical protein
MALWLVRAAQDRETSHLQWPIDRGKVTATMVLIRSPGGSKILVRWVNVGGKNHF